MLVPRPGARHAASVVEWLSFPVESANAVSQPRGHSTALGTGSGHRLPTTKLGWQAALGTALGEHAVLTPNGAV